MNISNNLTALENYVENMTNQFSRSIEEQLESRGFDRYDAHNNLPDDVIDNTMADTFSKLEIEGPGITNIIEKIGRLKQALFQDPIIMSDKSLKNRIKKVTEDANDLIDDLNRLYSTRTGQKPA